MRNPILQILITLIEDGKTITGVTVDRTQGQIGNKRVLNVHLDDGTVLKQELAMDYQIFRKHWNEMHHYRAMIQRMQGLEEI